MRLTVVNINSHCLSFSVNGATCWSLLLCKTSLLEGFSCALFWSIPKVLNHAMVMSKSEPVEYGIRDIFLAWDLDGNGFIEKSEFRSCCAELNLTNEQLSTIFKELDEDGDGRISLLEFSNGFQRVCSLFHVDTDDVLNRDKKENKNFEKLLDAIGVRGLLSG